jgi:hypothetical protein
MKKGEFIANNLKMGIFTASSWVRFFSNIIRRRERERVREREETKGIN